MADNVIAPFMFPPDKGSGSMHAFYMMSAKVTLLNITLHDTQCRGNTCDAIDTMNTRVCGCFQNSDNYAPVVMCLQLLITPPKDKGSTPQNFGEPFSCTAFTSKSFTRMCFKFPNMPSTVRSRHFSMRDNKSLIKSVDKVLDEINRRGGWTVMGWLKRGRIEDEAHKNDENIKKGDKIKSSNINHHLTMLEASNPDDLVHIADHKFSNLHIVSDNQNASRPNDNVARPSQNRRTQNASAAESSEGVMC